jgi:hypothetical protein
LVIGTDAGVLRDAPPVSRQAPGAVPEGKRSIWQFAQAQVFDAGPDGDVLTALGNTVFLREGVFIP